MPEPRSEAARFFPWSSHASLDPEAQRIHLWWLVRLRWGAIVGQALAIGVVQLALGIALPLAWLAGVLAFAATYNAATAHWLSTRPVVRELHVAAAMAGDVFLLTALLFFTGGPSNPFSFLYLVHIALAAVVLRAWWTWSLVALALACFGALFLLPDAAELLQTRATDPHAAHHAGHAMPVSAHSEHDMRMHLQGMWVAFGIAAGFIVYFVGRVTRDLAAREAELVAARAAATRNEKLAALATLAAGAAHELATPLSTIAVAAKDLERDLQRGAHDVLDDVRLIRGEVDRCRGILQQMSVESGQSAGEAAVYTQASSLIDEALAGLPDASRVVVSLDDDVPELMLCVPSRALGVALRGILKNACDAGAQHVRVHARRAPEGCAIEVRDDGPGMSEEVFARVGEPFFTTKEPGQGMGLGVFVARALLDQIGGRLELRSLPGQGTQVTLIVPPECKGPAAPVSSSSLMPAITS